MFGSHNDGGWPDASTQLSARIVKHLQPASYDLRDPGTLRIDRSANRLWLANRQSQSGHCRRERLWWRTVAESDVRPGSVKQRSRLALPPRSFSAKQCPYEHEKCIIALDWTHGKDFDSQEEDKSRQSGVEQERYVVRYQYRRHMQTPP